VLVLVCRDLIMYEFIYVFVYGTCNEFMCMHVKIYMHFCLFALPKTEKLQIKKKLCTYTPRAKPSA
jgi:hypothetical protein